MTVVIQIVKDAGPLGASSAHARRYVSFYDPDGYGGRGRINTVADPDQAMAFADVGAAALFCKRQSTTHPLRDDGEPNRPLTAYTVQILLIEEARYQ